MPRHWAGFALTAAVVVLDRVTKLWAEASIGSLETRAVVPGFFNLVRTENRGMAFGIFHEGATDLSRILLAALSIIVIGILLRMVHQGMRGAASLPAALFLVLGGALGNLYDRLVRGSVTDFLDFYAGEYHWPAFNVADAAITVGALWLVWVLWREERSRKPAPARGS